MSKPTNMHPQHHAVRTLLEVADNMNMYAMRIIYADGEEQQFNKLDHEAAALEILAVDQCQLHFWDMKADRRHWALLVLGNADYELIADYTVHPRMDELFELYSKAITPPKPKRHALMNWKAAMSILLLVLEDGTEKGKAQAREELMNLAAQVDAHNEQEDAA